MFEFLSLFVKLALTFVFIFVLLHVFLQHHDQKKLFRPLYSGAAFGSFTACFLYIVKKYWMRMEYLDIVEKGLLFLAIFFFFTWCVTKERDQTKKLSSFVIAFFSFLFSLVQLELLLLVSIPQLSITNGLNSEWINRIALLTLISLILMLIGIAMTMIGLKMDKKFFTFIFYTQFIILLFYQLVELLQLLFSLQILPLTMWALEILAPIVNHKGYFVLGVIVMTALFLYFLALCMEREKKVKRVDFTNPAEKRKILAQGKKVSRWLLTLSIAQIVIFSFLAGAHIIHAKEQIGKPPIEVSAINGTIQIEKQQVMEKELNLYSHIHQDGTESRFLIVAKTKENYGVGLDACAICGVAGYYEKDGHIICKKCDSVINMNTVGFMGGCNPIPIPFENTTDGTVKLKVTELEKYKALFQ